MPPSPFDAFHTEPAKGAACERLEVQFKASIGEYDQTSVHIEVKPRFLPDATGEFVFTQIIHDADVAQVVEDVNTLGNVRILDLTENHITDGVIEDLKKLKNLSEL